MKQSMRALLLGTALALGAAALSAHAAEASADKPALSGPPAGFVAPAEPKADETNAARAVTQPGNNAPSWRAVRESGNQPGFTTSTAPEAGTLIQSFTQYPGSRLTTAGEAWRQVRNGWMLPYGGALVLIALLAIAIFYWRKGSLGGHEVNTGRLIERVTPFERAAHQLNMVAFVVLAVSGLVMAFGRFFLLPVIGGTLFGWLTYALKTAHNFVGPLFVVSLLVVIVTFLRDNLPKKHDIEWLATVGGAIGNRHVPSGRFNAGEKIMFWSGVFVLGIIVSASGLVLNGLIPGLGVTRGQMQIANMVHTVSAVLMICVFIGHGYMGTLGLKGAWKAMDERYVDEAWAADHHSLWLDDIKSGKIPAQRSGVPPAPMPGAISTST